MDKSKNTTSEEAKKNCEGVKQTVTGLPRVDKWWIMTSLVEPQQKGTWTFDALVGSL